MYRGCGHGEVKNPPSEEGGYSLTRGRPHRYIRLLHRESCVGEVGLKSKTPLKVRGALFYKKKCTRFLSFVKGNLRFPENILQLVLFEQVADEIFSFSTRKISCPILGFFRIFYVFASKFPCNLLILRDFALRKIFFANLGNVPCKFYRRGLADAPRCSSPCHAQGRRLRVQIRPCRGCRGSRSLELSFLRPLNPF